MGRSSGHKNSKYGGNIKFCELLLSLDMQESYKHFSKTKPMKLEHFADVLK